MYNVIGECAYCGKRKRCAEELVEDSGAQYIYLFCKECNKQLEKDIKYFCE